MTGGWYANQKRKIDRSSINLSPYTAKWYRRSNNKEDPWVSLVDHHSSINTGQILYGENSYGGRHASTVLLDGVNVYVRFVKGRS